LAYNPVDVRSRDRETSHRVESAQMTESLNNRRLNLAAELRRSMVNGPGVRYVLWVQGCPLRCPGCFNEAFQPFVTRDIVPVDKLAERILSVEDIEGVTYSGGEPMVQAEALYSLSCLLKRHGLSIVCYSGFTLEQLHRSREVYVEKLLGLLDILIDGPYVQAEKANLLWRGSTNQKVHFLTDVYHDYQAQLETKLCETEITLDSMGMAITGTLQENVIERLIKLIRLRK
jgi:anaerobic ribonucleoside-triphosphate reductase activating protein